MFPNWMGFQPMMMPVNNMQGNMQNPMMMQGNMPRGMPSGMAGGMPAGMHGMGDMSQSMPPMPLQPGLTSRLSSDLPTLAATALETGKTEEEKQRAVVAKALKEIADTEKTKEKPKEDMEKKQSKKPAEEDVDKKPRCFLHSKPNKNCKKCQQALAASSQPSVKEVSEEKPREALDADEIMRRNNVSNKSKDDDKKNLQCSPMLKEQIVKSSYFKSLLDITSVDGLIHEIVEYVDTLDVYNNRDKTSPSCFMCHVFRLSVLAHIDNELGLLIDNRDYAVVRCVGFLYIRFVTAPNELWDAFEEYLLDDMELTYQQDGSDTTTTVGEYVESLLTQDKYFDSPLPRLPVKVRSMIEEKIAPLLQHRKRMAANRREITEDNVKDRQVEVNMDGTWLRGTAKDLINGIPSRVKVKVRLEGGVDVKVHLGKVVLVDRDSDDERDRRRGRSRSRSRGGGGGGNRGGGGRRGGSPDWSRWKGKSDAEMLQELKERHRENAVCGHGKAYARRPLNYDSGVASTAPPNPGLGQMPDLPHPGRASRASRRNEEEAAVAEETARRKRQEEDDRQRRLASVYKKYCAAPTASSSSAYKEVDTPDVLRFG